MLNIVFYFSGFIAAVIFAGLGGLLLAVGLFVEREWAAADTIISAHICLTMSKNIVRVMWIESENKQVEKEFEELLNATPPTEITR